MGGSSYVTALLLAGRFRLYALWRKREKLLGTVVMLAPLVAAFLISYYWTNQAMAWYYEKWDIYTSE